jgi:hypothetical protein
MVAGWLVLTLVSPTENPPARNECECVRLLIMLSSDDGAAWRQFVKQAV